MADRKWEDPVTIRHPDPEVGGPGGTSVVPYGSFVEAWQAKGFEIVPDAVAEASAVTGTAVDSLGALTKTQLEEVAAARGLDASGMTKAELVSALETGA